MRNSTYGDLNSDNPADELLMQRARYELNETHSDHGAYDESVVVLEYKVV